MSDEGVISFKKRSKKPKATPVAFDILTESTDVSIPITKKTSKVQAKSKSLASLWQTNDPSNTMNDDPIPTQHPINIDEPLLVTAPPPVYLPSSTNSTQNESHITHDDYGHEYEGSPNTSKALNSNKIPSPIVLPKPIPAHLPSKQIKDGEILHLDDLTIIGINADGDGDGDDCNHPPTSQQHHQGNNSNIHPSESEHARAEKARQQRSKQRLANLRKFHSDGVTMYNIDDIPGSHGHPDDSGKDHDNHRDHDDDIEVVSHHTSNKTSTPHRSSLQQSRLHQAYIQDVDDDLHHDDDDMLAAPPPLHPSHTLSITLDDLVRCWHEDAMKGSSRSSSKLKSSSSSSPSSPSSPSKGSSPTTASSLLSQYSKDVYQHYQAKVRQQAYNTSQRHHLTTRQVILQKDLAAIRDELKVGEQLYHHIQSLFYTLIQFQGYFSSLIGTLRHLSFYLDTLRYNLRLFTIAAALRPFNDHITSTLHITTPPAIIDYLDDSYGCGERLPFSYILSLSSSSSSSSLIPTTSSQHNNSIPLHVLQQTCESLLRQSTRESRLIPLLASYGSPHDTTPLINPYEYSDFTKSTIFQLFVNTRPIPISMSLDINAGHILSKYFQLRSSCAQLFTIVPKHTLRTPFSILHDLVMMIHHHPTIVKQHDLIQHAIPAFKVYIEHVLSYHDVCGVSAFPIQLLSIFVFLQTVIRVYVSDYSSLTSSSSSSSSPSSLSSPPPSSQDEEGTSSRAMDMLDTGHGPINVELTSAPTSTSMSDLDPQQEQEQEQHGQQQQHHSLNKAPDNLREEARIDTTTPTTTNSTNTTTTTNNNTTNDTKPRPSSSYLYATLYLDLYTRLISTTMDVVSMHVYLTFVDFDGKHPMHRGAVHPSQNNNDDMDDMNDNTAPTNNTTNTATTSSNNDCNIYYSSPMYSRASQLRGILSSLISTPVIISPPQHDNNNNNNNSNISNHNDNSNSNHNDNSNSNHTPFDPGTILSLYQEKVIVLSLEEETNISQFLDLEETMIDSTTTTNNNDSDGIGSNIMSSSPLQCLPMLYGMFSHLCLFVTHNVDTLRDRDVVDSQQVISSPPSSSSHESSHQVSTTPTTTAAPSFNSTSIHLGNQDPINNPTTSPHITPITPIDTILQLIQSSFQRFVITIYITLYREQQTVITCIYTQMSSQLQHSLPPTRPVHDHDHDHQSPYQHQHQHQQEKGMNGSEKRDSRIPLTTDDDIPLESLWMLYFHPSFLHTYQYAIASLSMRLKWLPVFNALHRLLPPPSQQAQQSQHQQQQSQQQQQESQQQQQPQQQQPQEQYNQYEYQIHRMHTTLQSYINQSTHPESYHTIDKRLNIGDLIHETSIESFDPTIDHGQSTSSSSSPLPRCFPSPGLSLITPPSCIYHAYVKSLFPLPHQQQQPHQHHQTKQPSSHSGTGHHHHTSTNPSSSSFNPPSSSINPSLSPPINPPSFIDPLLTLAIIPLIRGVYHLRQRLEAVSPSPTVAIGMVAHLEQLMCQYLYAVVPPPPPLPTQLQSHSQLQPHSQLNPRDPNDLSSNMVDINTNTNTNTPTNTNTNTNTPTNTNHLLTSFWLTPHTHLHYPPQLQHALAACHPHTPDTTTTPQHPNYATLVRLLFTPRVPSSSPHTPSPSPSPSPPLAQSYIAAIHDALPYGISIHERDRITSLLFSRWVYFLCCGSFAWAVLDAQWPTPAQPSLSHELTKGL